MRALPFLALVALACAPDTKEKDSHGTLSSGDSGPVECFGTPPEIESLIVTEGQPYTPTDGGETVPTIKLSTTYSDEDGDANVVRLDFWWDTTLDGTVDTSVEPNQATEPTALKDSDGNVVEDCYGHAGTFNSGLGVTGGDLDYETTYDFAVILYDKSDTASEPAFASGTTPAAL